MFQLCWEQIGPYFFAEKNHSSTAGAWIRVCVCVCVCVCARVCVLCACVRARASEPEEQEYEKEIARNHSHFIDLAMETPPAPSLPCMQTSSTRNVMYFLPPMMIPLPCSAVGLLKPLRIMRASPSDNCNGAARSAPRRVQAGGGATPRKLTPPKIEPHETRAKNEAGP